MDKKYLTPKEAVAAGYFPSEKTAANLRAARRGPKFFKPNGGKVIYLRTELDEWIRKGIVLTIDSLPAQPKSGGRHRGGSSAPVTP